LLVFSTSALLTTTVSLSKLIPQLVHDRVVVRVAIVASENIVLALIRIGPLS